MTRECQSLLHVSIAHVAPPRRCRAYDSRSARAQSPDQPASRLQIGVACAHTRAARCTGPHRLAPRGPTSTRRRPDVEKIPRGSSRAREQAAARAPPRSRPTVPAVDSTIDALFERALTAQAAGGEE